MAKIYINTGYGLVVKTCKEENIEKAIALVESKGMTCTVKRI